MFHSDQPIYSSKDDILNRGVFSKELAKAITLYTQKENFVVGLCGRWGCGKTSILNLVIEEIEELTKLYDNEKKPIIIRFNPWNYSECSQLISQFFETISATLKTKDLGDNLSKVGEALDKYSSILEYTQYIPVVGNYFKPLTKIAESTGELLEQCADREKSIDVQKEKVIKALEEQERKFIVIVDDIDRLNNSQIRAIFQLVNSVAGFPNMLYLLAFDREVVARALQQEQGCDGELYLEKIIQVPFDVPDVNLELLSRAFVDRYLDIINSGVGVVDFDEAYWGNVYGVCVRPFVKSIRDLNRILNAFEFKYNLMRDETNPIDLLVITVLSIYAREMYEWIRINKSFLTGAISSQRGISGAEQKRNREEYSKLFSEINSERGYCMLEIVQILFPKFGWETGAYSFSSDTEDELRKKKRLASSEKIKNYFCLSIEDIPVTQIEISKSIWELDEKQLEDFLYELVERDSIDYYLGELLARVDEIPEEREILIITTLVSFSSAVILQDSKYKFSYIPRRTFLSIIEKVLEKRDKKENLKLIIELLDKSNEKTISIIAELISDIKRSFENKHAYYAKNQFICEEDLSCLQNKFMGNVQSKIKNIFEVYNNRSLIGLWMDLDIEKYDEHISGLMKDAINIPKLLSLCHGSWTSSTGETGWSFSEENFGKYISSDNAYEAICSLKKGRFNELNDMEKKIAIAFVRWYESDNKNVDTVNQDVSLSRVMEDLSKWESGCNAVNSMK